MQLTRIIIACLAGLVGKATAAAVGAVGAGDNVGRPLVNNHNHGFVGYQLHTPSPNYDDSENKIQGRDPVQISSHTVDKIDLSRSDTHQNKGRDLLQPPSGPVYRCHDPYPDKFGPAPPVEDCNDVIQQFAALTTDINVKLVEGCYQIVSGNCTGLVCPQRVGESTIPGAVAAQYMASPLRDECIAKGQRGWWIDGQGWGIGVYLT